MLYSLINFKVFGDYSGNLVALEGGRHEIPFDIKRIYYIWGAGKNIVRGKHAHKKLEQIVICMSGSCDFILDDGRIRETVHLSCPNQGLYMKNNIWGEFTNFSSDCVIMVIASDHYDEADYIRNYDDFLKESAKNGNNAI